MNKEFTEIEGYPKYGVSRDGRIVNSRNHEKALQNSRDGYIVVNLYCNGKESKKRVHRLVAETYIPNPDNKPDVNHKDGNKHNNSVSNLEWTTKSENMIHAYQTGLNKPHASYGMLGHKNPNGGRKGNKVRIVETGESFESIIDCATAIGGSDRCICDCLNGRQNTHKGYHFERI